MPKRAVLPPGLDVVEQGLLSASGVDVLSDSLSYLINRTDVRCYQLLAGRLPTEMSPARLAALSLIGSHPGLSQKALGTLLKVASPNMVKMINALEELGYVVRASMDRRSYALTLTPVGAKALTRFRRAVDEHEREIAGHLSEVDRATLIDLLRRIAPPAGGA